MTNAPISTNLLHKMDGYGPAANYFPTEQINLYDNPFLKEPLKLSHLEPLVVGHSGTTPGQNFICVHLNRVIEVHDLDMFYISGPGHGGQAIVGNVYLEGAWSEVYRDITQEESGLKKPFKQFSFSGGISSHVSSTTPARALVHRLTHRRSNRNLHVHGYKEEGTIATAFDMRVQNEMDCYHLVQKVLDCLPHPGSRAHYLKQMCRDKLVAHKLYIDAHGQDMPEILEWTRGTATQGDKR